jgi:hypothetical protein
VHFMVDAQHAKMLRKRWDNFGFETPLRIVDCPDRQITRAAQTLVVATHHEHRDTNVTVLLPRRTYAPILGRLLHDRTADKIARAISRIPDAAATIVPYDVQSRINEAFPDSVEHRISRELAKVEARIRQGDNRTVDSYEHPERPTAVTSVEGLIPGLRATVEGRVSEVQDNAKDGRTYRSIMVGDETGDVRVDFKPGQGEDIQPGQVVRVTGKARESGHGPKSMTDPIYRIVEQPEQV